MPALNLSHQTRPVMRPGGLVGLSLHRTDQRTRGPTAPGPAGSRSVQRAMPREEMYEIDAGAWLVGS